MKNKSRIQTLRPSAVAGLCGALMIVLAMLFSSASVFSFFNLEGLLIVVGGVMAVAYMSYQPHDVRAAMKAIRGMFTETPVTHADLYRDVADFMAWARIVKQKGLLGLEGHMGGSNGANIDDPFVRYGLTMVITDYSAEEVRAMLETAADAFYERDVVPAQVLQAMASHAPAFGMVGTLLGMVTMLYNLNGSTEGIGSSLAISFLATLYGVVSARMIYMPAAAKLTHKLDTLRYRNHLITEGMVMLVSNKTPTYIQDRLNSFLSPEIHDGLMMNARQQAVLKLQAVR